MCRRIERARRHLQKHSGERSARYRKAAALEYGGHDIVPNLDAAFLFSAWLNLN